jgi:hypothetical protein
MFKRENPPNVVRSHSTTLNKSRDPCAGEEGSVETNRRFQPGVTVETNFFASDGFFL